MAFTVLKVDAGYQVVVFVEHFSTQLRKDIPMADFSKVGSKPKARSFLIPALALLVAAIGALAQTSQKPASSGKKAVTAAGEAKPVEPPNVLVQLNGALETLAAKVSPAVVQILPDTGRCAKKIVPRQRSSSANTRLVRE